MQALDGGVGQIHVTLMKRTDPKSIKEIFEESLQMADTAAFHQQRACYKWIEVLGPGVAKYTARRHISPDGTMTVEVTSASLKQMLTEKSETIISMLNASVGKNVVTKLKII